MTNPPKKSSQTILFTVAQAEVLHKLAIEQFALARETLALVTELTTTLREGQGHMALVANPVPVEANKRQGKIIPFRAQSAKDSPEMERV